MNLPFDTCRMHKRLILSAMALFCCGNLPAAETLENDALSIRFSDVSDGFAVTGIVNRLGGMETRFLFGNGNDPSFWSLEFMRHLPNGSNELFSVDNMCPCGERRCVRTEMGLRFLWKGIDLGEGAGRETDATDVAADVWLDPTDGMSRWTLHVRCRAKEWALYRTTYPTLSGIVREGEGDVLRPDAALGARLFKGCCWDKGVLGVQYGYPGNFPMVTAYNQGEAGLYIAAHDPDCREKSYICTKGEYVRFQTLVENAGVVGKAAAGPGYPIVVGAYRGDWWTAARIYRNWATKQKWTAKGKKAFRKDYPKGMAESDLWLIANFAYDGVSNLMVRAAKAWPDVDKAIEFTEWNYLPFDTGYPAFFPPRKGFAEVNAFARKIGFMTMPYTNGMLWDQDLPSYAELAMPGMVKQVDGRVSEQVWRSGEGHFGTVCPSWKPFHNIIESTAWRLVREFNVGSVYIDQIGFLPVRPCFDATHGHVLGGGNHWWKGFHDALIRVHEKLSSASAPITSEGMGECWMDVIDGYLNANVPTMDQVPFFPAVYSAYAQAFGCRPESSISADDFRYYQARATLYGSVPGWVGPWILDEGHRRHADALYACARLRKAVREFLAWGELEDKVRFDGDTSGVLGAVWKNASGTDLCVVLANVSGKSQRVRFAMPTSSLLSPVKISGEKDVLIEKVDGMAEVALPPYSFSAWRTFGTVWCGDEKADYVRLAANEAAVFDVRHDE